MAKNNDTFLNAVKDVRPLKVKSQEVLLSPKKPKPIPKKLIEDERNVLNDSLSDHYLHAELESDENTFYLKKGHSPEIINKLRRGYWTIQQSLDLHGFTSDEAKIKLVGFLNVCQKKGIRCVRVIHGKGFGSVNKEPILKKRVRGWLIQKQEIIAYVEAPRHDGGSGAIIVLIEDN